MDEDRQNAAVAKVGHMLHEKWRLDRLIAVGGMGAVYVATHRNGMRGAVKILDESLGQSITDRERFRREGRLANGVHHSGVVRVLDDDETADGTAYLVMELLEGATLEELAERAGGKLPAIDVIAYGLQVLSMLAEAHASGIIHRDIKPENLLLTNDGIVKVLDFGIAGMLARDSSAKLTRTGELIGTPAFMSPEQARGRTELVDEQSDLYGLGASLFTLMSGKLVHEGAGTMAELLALTITCDARSLRDVMPDAPDALVRAIDRALAREKSDRWANAAAMRAALEEGYFALAASRARTPVRAPDSARVARRRRAHRRGRRARSERRRDAETS